MKLDRAIRTVFREKYATFSGRASRSEYWWTQLLLIAALLGTLLVLIIAGVMIDTAAESAGLAIIAVVALVWIAAIPPLIAVTVRRLHDRNMSGWWCLLYLAGVVSYAGLIVVIVMTVILALKGTDGRNRFDLDATGAPDKGLLADNDVVVLMEPNR